MASDSAGYSLKVNILEEDSPILFHTDLSKIERSTLRKLDPKSDLISSLHRLLKETFPKQELWFPAFNYDYTKTRTYDPVNDPVQVGLLNDSLRNSEAYARSLVPVFSILRPKTLRQIEFKRYINPFDHSGEFSEITKRNGYISFFGASINSLTYIHYVENLVAIPYRYEKVFQGQTKTSKGFEKTSLSYLVRPSGMLLEYDWSKIHFLVNQAQVSFTIDNFGSYNFYNASNLNEFMLTQYSKDMFWTLTTESKIEAQRKLEELGRSFKIEDFESGMLDV